MIYYPKYGPFMGSVQVTSYYLHTADILSLDLNVDSVCDPCPMRMLGIVKSGYRESGELANLGLTRKIAIKTVCMFLCLSLCVPNVVSTVCLKALAHFVARMYDSSFGVKRSKVRVTA